MPPTLRNPAVQYGFNRTNPKAEAYAKDVAARLITGIADRTAIRDLIYRAFSENRPPASTARMIRAYIGLLPSQAQAVENLRDLMRSSPGKLLYAGKTRIRVPEGGASDELIDQRAEEYADRLLNQRAEMISRTETLAASNEGQRLLWDQAIEDGLLTGGEKRKWLWTEGLDKIPCPLCSAMDGELTGIDEPWTLPDGFESMDGETEVMVPQQVHPHCRCGQGLVTEAQMADQREQDQQAEDEANLEMMSERVLGGAGSGNFGHAGRPGEQGGSSSDDGSALEGKGGRDLTRAERLTIGEWQMNDRIPSKTRRDMEVMLRDTKPGGSLEHLRPAVGTEVWRGQDREKLQAGARSFSTKEKDAKSWGKFKQTLTITSDVLAIDLSKIQPSENEVIVYVKESDTRTLGGPGPGFFGHAGRPGETGGSSEGDGVRAVEDIFYDDEKDTL